MINLHVLRKPTLKSAQQLLEDSLRENKIIVTVGSCIVDYEGRASSMLSEGERLVIVKPDGTVLVHQTEKRKPVNWNPPGCVARVDLREGGLWLISRRSNPPERLSILFKDLKIAASFDLVDKESLQLVGTEEDLVKSVLKKPDLIEEGFKPIEREKSTRSGVIDLYGTDSEGRKVAVEFKRGKATLSAVGQLSRYIKELEKQTNGKIRGILVAPKITSGALRLLRKEGLEYVRVKDSSDKKSTDIIYDKNQKRIKEY